MSQQHELEAAVRIATNAGDLIRRFFVDGDADAPPKDRSTSIPCRNQELRSRGAPLLHDARTRGRRGTPIGGDSRSDAARNLSQRPPVWRVRLQVSAIAAPSEAKVASGFPSGKRHRDINAEPFHRVCPAVQGLRRSGCAGLDLAYVSCGRFDGMWDWGLEKWDLAAGLLLVNEAGGVCSDWDGQPYALGNPGLIAAGPGLHESLRLLLSRDRHDSDPILDS